MAVIVNSNRVQTHHNTPKSVHASWDLASKTVNSKDAHLRSDFLGVVRHGGAEQSFSLEGGVYGEESLLPDGNINR